MLEFGQALVLIFLAELGDKSQLVTLAFATRYRPLLVLAAISTAALLVHLVSVTVGTLLGLALPLFWIRLGAGVAFVAFGLWTLRGDTDEEEDASATARFGPFLTIASTFFLGELGDKTMLATITVAGQRGSFVLVWLGATLGMVLADALAIGLGVVAGRRLPRRAIQLFAAAVFLVFGLSTLATTLLGTE